MDVQKKLDDIAAALSGARSVPMSASCVVNRAELIALVDEVRQALPGSLAQAQELLGDREQMVQEAQAEATRIIESAQAQGGSLVSDTEVARRSQAEADRILTEARNEAEAIRAEADDYVDSKLANFEVVLTKTIGSVDRGREKMLGRAPGTDYDPDYDPQDPDYVEPPERSSDPETLRRRADAYVDAKFGAFEAVLSKTLEAVGRGRQKLQGARAIDELGAHLAAQGEAGVHTGDADYLAALAALSDEPGRGPARPVAEAPAQEPVAHAPLPHEAVQQPMPHDPMAQQMPEGYEQHEAYAGYQGVPDYQGDAAYGHQQDPYGYPQQGYEQQVVQDPYAYHGGWQPQGDPYAAAGDPAAMAQQGYEGGVYLPHQQTGALDETSLFDTSMIDLDQLRRYEDGQYRTG